MSSSVLIGVLDDSYLDSNSSSFLDNRIGGCPQFSPHLDLSKLDISCKSCSVDCTFLLQIYCPVDQSPNDRVLYLFLCTNIACSNRDIICLRTLTEPLSLNQSSCSSKNDKLFDDQWSDDEDNWNVESKEKVETELSDRLSSLDVSLIEVSSKSRKFKELFQQRYISVFEEPHKEDNKSENKNDFSKFFDETEMKDQTCSVEQYEKSYSSAFGDNRTNYQFYKRINRCSNQIIRYDWSGVPLLFNDDCLKTPQKNCENCNSPRVFELQLMPALISIFSQLKLDNFSVEFDTVYIFSCSKNCSNNNQFYREEAILYCEDYNKEQYYQFEESR